MTVKIRPITFEDAPGYRQCFNAVAKERRYFAVDKAAPLALIRTNLRRRLRSKIPFLVAADGERIIGWAAVFRPDIPALCHNGDLIVGVRKEYRRQGLGAKLAAGVLRMARARFDSVLFCFVAKNKAARKLSEKMGFKLCARERKFLKLAYGFDDQLITQKLFRR